MTAGSEDGDLVRRAQTGDREAFGLLVRRYQRAVYGFVVRLTGSEETAGDVTQEVFVRAWQYFARFDAQRPLRPWLFRIAANRVASRKEREAARPEVSLEELEGEPAGDECVSTDLERRELATTVHRAIGQLSAQQREAIVLCELEGQTAPEAAMVMGCSAATVRQHVFRGKKRLRDLLAGYLDGLVTGQES